MVFVGRYQHQGGGHSRHIQQVANIVFQDYHAPVAFPLQVVPLIDHRIGVGHIVKRDILGALTGGKSKGLGFELILDVGPLVVFHLLKLNTGKQFVGGMAFEGFVVGISNALFIGRNHPTARHIASVLLFQTKIGEMNAVGLGFSGGGIGQRKSFIIGHIKSHLRIGIHIHLLFLVHGARVGNDAQLLQRTTGGFQIAGFAQGKVELVIALHQAIQQIVMTGQMPAHPGRIGKTGLQ